MTQFLSKSFSVALGLSEKGRANYDRVFGKKKRKRTESAKPTAAMKARSRAGDAEEQRREADQDRHERMRNLPDSYQPGSRW